MAPFTESFTYVLTATITYGTCAVAGTCLVLCHILFPSSQKSSPPKYGKSTGKWKACWTRFRKEKMRQNVILVCTWLSIFGYYLMILLALGYRMQDLRLFQKHNWCNDYMKVSASMWWLGKYNMYMVFTARLHVAFDKTAFSYSDRTIYALYSVITTLFLVLLGMVPFLALGDTSEMKGDPPNDHMVVCVAGDSNAMVFLASATDLFLAPTLVTMFVRPLQKLFRVTGAHASDHLSVKQIEMQMLPLKYTMITSIAIISTFSSLIIMALTGASLLAIVDCVVNMSCLVIMTSRWKRVYWRMCAPLLRIISHFNCCFDDELRSNLNRAIKSFAGASDPRNIAAATLL